MAAFLSDATEAVKTVQANKGEEDYALMAFNHPKKCDELSLLSSGKGGIEELAKNVPEGDVAYGLVRVKFTYEKCETTKFVHVHWRPDNIPLSRKMKIGILDSKIKKSFGQYSAYLEASTTEELTEEKVQEVLGDIAGTVDKTGNKAATFAATGQMTSSSLLSAKTSNNGGVLMPTGTAADNMSRQSGLRGGASVTFDDRGLLKEKLEAVKSGKADWALWTYSDAKTLSLAGSGGGGGGLAALLEAAPLDEFGYGVFTVSETLDVSDTKKGGIKTTKYCYLTWHPEENVPPIRKAKYSTHKGAVRTAIREHFPFQYDFSASQKDELSETDVLESIGRLTGTKVGAATEKKKVVSVDASPSSLNEKVAKALELDYDSDIVDAIGKVRSDADESNFAVAKFDDSQKLVLVSTGDSGASGASELLASISPPTFSYVLLRYTEQIDDSTCVKFRLVAVHDARVAPKLKGNLSTYVGKVRDLFSPFHTSATLDSPDDSLI